MSLTPRFDDLALWLALSSTTDLWLVTLGTWPQNRKHKRFPCKYSGKELVWEMGAVAWEENERTALRIMATWNIIPHSTRRGEYAACSQTGRMCVCVFTDCGLRDSRDCLDLILDHLLSPSAAVTHSHLSVALNMIIFPSTNVQLYLISLFTIINRLCLTCQSGCVIYIFFQNHHHYYLVACFIQVIVIPSYLYR